jgi:hypothetical protein
MFFTRPELPPLNLDLVALNGGGSCPSQFYGETVDGRPVYIRYRGGSFSVRRGQPGGSTHDLDSMDMLLEAQVGPVLHGDMLLEQACDIAGITIRGQRPTLSDAAFRAAADDGWILDFSGAITYWMRHLAFTEATRNAAVQALGEAFTDLVLLDHRYGQPLVACDRIEACERVATLGIGRIPGALERLWNRSDVRNSEVREAFAHVIHLSFWRLDDVARSPSDLEISARVGRPITTANPFTGLVSMQFRTGDDRGQAFVRTLIAVMDSYFDNRLEYVDMATDVLVDTAEDWRWRCRDLATWCHAAPDRYLGVAHTQKDSGLPPLLGVRPRRRVD